VGAAGNGPARLQRGEDPRVEVERPAVAGTYGIANVGVRGIQDHVPGFRKRDGRHPEGNGITGGQPPVPVCAGGVRAAYDAENTEGGHAEVGTIRRAGFAHRRLRRVAVLQAPEEIAYDLRTRVRFRHHGRAVTAGPGEGVSPGFVTAEPTPTCPTGRFVQITHR